MKSLLMTLVLLSTSSVFAGNAYNKIYECKTLEMKVTKKVSIFANLLDSEVENAPALIVIDDGLKSKALEGSISLLGTGNLMPWQKATTVISAATIGFIETDLAISIDLSAPRKISMFKKANGLMGLVKAGTLDANRLEHIYCEFKL
jgi:hypothetical protein